MSKQTEALKLALEALEYQVKPLCMCFAGCDNCDPAKVPDIESAITAIREALAEQPAQQQEPVAGLRCKVIESCKSCQHSVGRLSCSLADRDFDSLERSFVPPDWCPLPIYTSPQNKPWVGLTPQSQANIAEANNMLVDDDLFDAIEAKLREKNT